MRTIALAIMSFFAVITASAQIVKIDWNKVAKVVYNAPSVKAGEAEGFTYAMQCEVASESGKLSKSGDSEETKKTVECVYKAKRYKKLIGELKANDAIRNALSQEASSDSPCTLSLQDKSNNEIALLHVAEDAALKECFTSILAEQDQQLLVIRTASSMIDEMVRMQSGRVPSHRSYSELEKRVEVLKVGDSVLGFAKLKSIGKNYILIATEREDELYNLETSKHGKEFVLERGKVHKFSMMQLRDASLHLFVEVE